MKYFDALTKDEQEGCGCLMLIAILVAIPIGLLALLYLAIHLINKI